MTVVKRISHHEHRANGAVASHYHGAVASHPNNIPLRSPPAWVSRPRTYLPTFGSRYPIGRRAVDRRDGDHVAYRNPTNRPVNRPEALIKKLEPRVEKPFQKDTFEQDLKRYHQGYQGRMQDCRKWVMDRHAEHRFDHGLRQELLTYLSKKKYDNPPQSVSKYANEALDLMEHDIGTDLQWANDNAWILARHAPMFKEVIENKAKDEVLKGPGYVGEEDLESFIAESARCKGSVIGDWGKDRGQVAAYAGAQQDGKQAARKRVHFT